jgi:hypothetical protein
MPLDPFTGMSEIFGHHGPTLELFYFDRGARLSFGLTLREQGCRGIVAPSMDLHDFTIRFPEYLRFDLNERF